MLTRSKGVTDRPNSTRVDSYFLRLQQLPELDEGEDPEMNGFEFQSEDLPDFFRDQLSVKDLRWVLRWV